ncbi:MAG: hypothetical protein LBS82_00845, partial [Spirochaetaceae bacterium]|nr:hypothetical protein [Spirochaetaceae bacterium]
MNTTRTTFNDGESRRRRRAALSDNPLPAYTVVGGKERGGDTGLSAILLNRGSRYPRRSLFAELEKAGFDAIVSIELSVETYDLDALSTQFPSVTFILLPGSLNVGCQINIAASEVKGPLFFVLWNDLKFLYGGCAAKIVERLLVPFDKAAEGAAYGGAAKTRMFKRFCTVPVFQNPDFEALPTASNPVLIKKTLELAPSTPEKEDAPTLYPYDAVGVYDKQRFLELGGFDRGMRNEYWQLLDLGFRAWLWGEEIRCTQFIRLRHEGPIKIEDSSADESKRRFTLKNLSPVLRYDAETTGLYAHLPLRSLWRFLSQA